MLAPDSTGACGRRGCTLNLRSSARRPSANTGPDGRRAYGDGRSSIEIAGYDNMKIWIVDDDPASMRVLSMMLEQKNYETQGFTEAQVLLQQLSKEDLPDPLSPVMTTSWSRGMMRSMFLRLCSRAPRMMMLLPDTPTPPTRGPRAGGRRRTQSGPAS